MQFGDDILGSATDEMRAMLERKNQWKRQFHIGRLQEQGMTPHVPRAASHQDPFEDAIESYDSPPAPPPQEERRLQELESPEAPAHSSHSLLSTISNGANSTAANMGAGIVHGVTYGVAAASTAVAKGLANGLVHYATGVNPLSVPDDEEELVPDRSEEPLRPFPKAKAQPQSSGSHFPWPFSKNQPEEAAKPKPFVDAASYNGTGEHAFYIGSSEDEAPGPAAAARRPRNRLAQRDVRLAQETLTAYPDLGRRRRG